MRCRFGLVGACAMLLARPLVAQQAEDSLAFRRGQWGAEFAAGYEARSLGVLRFLSPRRALVFDVNGGYTKSTREASGEVNNRELQARLGVRWFRDLAPRLRQYLTVGASGGARRERQERPATASSPAVIRSTHVTLGGAFANVGGMWLVSSHLALGAQWEASYTGSRTRDRDPNSDTRTTTHQVSVGGARLVVSLLF